MRLVWSLPFGLCACINTTPASGAHSNSALDALIQGIQSFPNALFGPQPDDPRLDEWFSPKEKALIVGARAQFQTIQTPSDLQLALAAAITATHTINQVAGDKPFEATDDVAIEADFGWLRRLHPTLDMGLGPENVYVEVSMSMEPWLAKARSTPGNSDDDYLLLVNRVYGEPTRESRPVWLIGDYMDDSYCSVFGSGIHLSFLQNIQKQLELSSIFKKELQEIRQKVLDDIIARKSAFLYCANTSGQPTPEAQLQAEADAILQSIELSSAEVKRIKARKREHFIRKE